MISTAAVVGTDSAHALKRDAIGLVAATKNAIQATTSFGSHLRHVLECVAAELARQVLVADPQSASALSMAKARVEKMVRLPRADEALVVGDDHWHRRDKAAEIASETHQAAERAYRARAAGGQNGTEAAKAARDAVAKLAKVAERANAARRGA